MPWLICCFLTLVATVDLRIRGADLSVVLSAGNKGMLFNTKLDGLLYEKRRQVQSSISMNPSQAPSYFTYEEILTTQVRSDRLGERMLLSVSKIIMN